MSFCFVAITQGMSYYGTTSIFAKTLKRFSVGTEPEFELYAFTVVLFFFYE